MSRFHHQAEVQVLFGPSTNFIAAAGNSIWRLKMEGEPELVYKETGDLGHLMMIIMFIIFLLLCCLSLFLIMMMMPKTTSFHLLKKSFILCAFGNPEKEAYCSSRRPTNQYVMEAVSQGWTLRLVKPQIFRLFFWTRKKREGENHGIHQFDELLLHIWKIPFKSCFFWFPKNKCWSVIFVITQLAI